MGNGTTADRLFGGVDIKEFTVSGKINYLLENSWMNHKYVIFEEMLDAPSEILEQLKDIISSGYFRAGGQKFKIKTEFIVCCTNRNRNEFAKTMSLKALMERFPLQKEFKWEKYNAVTYSKLIETRLGRDYLNPMLMTIMEEYAGEQTFISPRIAIKASELVYECGIDCIDYIAEFQDKPDIIKNAKIRYSFTIKFNKLNEDTNTIFKRFKDIETKGTVNEIKSLIANMQAVKKEFEALKATDDLIAKVAQRKTEIDNYISWMDRVSSLMQSEEDLINF